ncbi:Zinc finger and BTB domain-containing protein 49 [Lucilia cuprina]|nr:Zinc finger and BTB domain-containing protein 49 [Lucilia cuprina]
MLTAFVMPNDLSDLCRVCLQLPEESQYLDLTTIYDEDDHLTYGECFTICTQIDLSAGEGVPHHLCKPCGLELQMSYDFHKKIEESKRVIEQCQKQIEEQKRNSNTDESEGLHTNTSGEGREVVQLLNEKYVISDDEEDVDEERAVSSQEMQNVSIMQSEFNTPAQEDDETDEMNIINKICHIEDKDTNTTMEHMDEHDVANDAEEMDDYQNLETLEDEEERLNDDIVPPEEEIITNTTITPCIPAGIRLPLPAGPPFICEFCGHSSKTKALLASHRHRKHRHKESAYQCEKCDQQFSSKDVYDKHLKRVSCQKYPEFQCEFCSKKIIGSANYKIHLRFHKKIYPFECDQCGKGFMLAVHLKVHKQTKHENKRYVCEEANCGKFFKSQQSLKNHTYVHLGSLPYSCEYCGKMFTNRGSLRWHLKTCHGREVTGQDLERMLVSAEISIKAEVQSVEFCEEEDKKEQELKLI